jgi:hypothetical protein
LVQFEAAAERYLELKAIEKAATERATSDVAAAHADRDNDAPL